MEEMNCISIVRAMNVMASNLDKYQFKIGQHWEVGHGWEGW
jgi:hypothetical protein